MDVQFLCVIQKASVEEKKKKVLSHTASPTQYSFPYLREPRLRL